MTPKKRKELERLINERKDSDEIVHQSVKMTGKTWTKIAETAIKEDRSFHAALIRKIEK